MPCPFFRGSRRQFIKGAVAAFAATCLIGGPLAAFATPDPYPQAWSPFEGGPGETFWGDVFDTCHALRDGQVFAVVPSTESCEVVVLGGGVSGLATAWLLRDKKPLILEKDPQPGGTSKAAHWQGITYPTGAIYCGQPDDTLKKFYDDIGVNMIEIPKPEDVLLHHGAVVEDYFGAGIVKAPFSDKEIASFQAAWKHFTELNNSADLPTIPLDKTTAESYRTDDIVFADYIQEYEQPVKDILDLYLKSCWGVGADKVSAFGALNFLCSEFGPTYTSPEGNGRFVARLQDKVRHTVRTGCYVTHVEQKNNTVEVSYLHHGLPKTVRARSVVVAAPKHIAVRFLSGLEEDRIHAMRTMRHGAYMNASLYLDRPLPHRGWDFWSLGRIYCDVLAADWILTAGGQTLDPNRHTVAVASLPMGEKEGRNAILSGDYHSFASRLRADLEQDFPGLGKHVRGIRFARYGHAMAIPYPGFMRKVAPVLQRPWGRVFFAHCDTYALPCVESAIYAAMDAARRVQALG